MKDNNNFEEKKVADKVADELLIVNEKKDVGYFGLVLIFVVCLIFLISSVSFAVFNSVVNNNAIDVKINVDDDEQKPDTDEDEKTDDDKNSDNDQKTNDDTNNSSNNTNNNSSSDKKQDNDSSDKDTVLFTFNSGSNYIDMENVFSMSDAEGIALKGDKEYFDFNISALNASGSGSIVYEVSLVPSDDNTISEDFIRVYMTENGEAVSVLNEDVSNFSDLPKSSFSTNGRVIYKKTVDSSYNGNYIFKMWVSSKADSWDVSKKFGCRVMVNAYYK